MTISAALTNALSGLSATGRASVLISDNIANALTPGYAKRQLELTSGGVSGQGVQVVGITRRTDPVLTANRRASEAAAEYGSVLAQFHSSVERLIGPVDNPASLPNRLAELESSLVTAASNPGSATRLDAAASAARDIGQTLQSAAAGLRDLRSRADRNIGLQVDSLNSALINIDKLNTKIQSVKLSGGETAALFDQRQQLVDQVNAIIPIKIAPRANDQISLYTAGGAILLDGSPASLAFSVAPSAEPHMTIANGLLSALQINGIPVRTSGESSPIRGGSLAAEFEIRDVATVKAQQNLDAVALDLVNRFADPAVDPTLDPADPGLFTDSGAAFIPGNEVGLSNRLTLNPAGDPAQGGESWRLRDGLNAITPGVLGDSALLTALNSALSDPRPLIGASLGTGALTAAEAASALLSDLSHDSSTAAKNATFAAASHVEFQRIEQELGVNTDEELQSLVRIEQAYAANARVLEVVGDLMDTLLRI